MKPREFVQLAVELSRSAQPSRLRTAISRAYYGVFHELSQLLTEFHIRVSKGPNAHGDIRHRLGNSGDPDLAELASRLAELHAKRIDADYRLDSPAPSRVMKSCTSSMKHAR